MPSTSPFQSVNELAILLPPSEGKSPGGRTPKWSAGSGSFGRELGGSRRLIIKSLATSNGGDSRNLGVSGAHLDRARYANTHLEGAPTLPAWQRYTGVVWDHLDPASLSASSLRRAQESIIIFSGLLGLVAFSDPIPDYKLKMGASLSEIGKLSTWWRPTLSDTLNSRLQSRVVIDLLPLEHRAAWIPNLDLGPRHLVVTFVNNAGRTVGHDAKAAKGLLVRHLLDSKGSPQQALKSWRHPHFSLTVSTFQ